MKQRLPFLGIVAVLVVVLFAAELFLPHRSALLPLLSATPTKLPAKTLPAFVPFPSHPPIGISPTSIPLQATHTSIAGETPDLLATQTLLPIDTPTLMLPEPQASFIPTQTLIFFPTPTSTPFGGSATPPVPVAYSIDGKPKSCYGGPSLAYIELTTFNISRIAGKDQAGAWWYLLVYKGQGNYVSCWVAGEQVTTGGNLDSLSVVEPELSQVTQVKVSAPGQPATATEYIATIICDDGITNTTLRFAGQISSNGPLSDVGYRWDTDAPVKFTAAHTPIPSWDVPAQLTVALPVPSMAATYSLSLRTTFPMEAIGRLQVIVRCQ